MKKIWMWIVGITIVVLIGTVILLGIGLLRTQRMPLSWYQDSEPLWRERGWFSHGMGMRGSWGLPVMGLFGWLIMLAFPLGILTLIILGTIYLVQAIQKPQRDPSEPMLRHCDSCGREISPDWKVCPYCGESLGEV